MKFLVSRICLYLFALPLQQVLRAAVAGLAGQQGPGEHAALCASVNGKSAARWLGRGMGALGIAVMLCLTIAAFLPVLTVMQFVTLHKAVAAEARFYANSSVLFRFHRHGKDFSCWGHYFDVRVHPPLHHVPHASAKIEMTGPCEGDASDDLLGNIEPSFRLSYSMAGRDAFMHWYKPAFAQFAPLPAPPELGDEPPGAGEVPETPPWVELFDATVMRVELLRLVALVH